MSIAKVSAPNLPASIPLSDLKSLEDKVNNCVSKGKISAGIGSVGLAASLSAIAVKFAYGSAISAPILPVSIALGIISLIFFIGGIVALYLGKQIHNAILPTEDAGKFPETLVQGKLVTQTSPVTEAVLKVPDVSYVLFNDPKFPNDPTKSMAFPISQTAALGSEGGPAYSSSEAIWYTLQNAYNAGDQTLFQQTLNAYLYLVNQKQASIASANQSSYANQWAATAGLMGWTFNLGSNPPGINIQNNLNGVAGAFPYATNNASDQGLSSATDADEQIINMMIQASSTWGDMSIHCFGTFPQPFSPLPPGDPALPAPILDMQLSALLQTAVTSFMAYDVSNANTPPVSPPTRNGFTYDGINYYPILTNDNWGHNVLNPSYADFTTAANLYNYMTANGVYGSSPAFLAQAAVNTVGYLTALQKDCNGGLPDNPTWKEVGNGPTSVGWDSIRFLTNGGMYMFNCNHKGLKDPFGVLANVVSMTKTMLGYIWSIGVNPGAPDMTLNNGSTLTGPALLGPMLLAMKALALDGNLPDGITEADVQMVENSLNAAMTYDPNNQSPTVWQQNYYAVELYLVNEYEASLIPAPSGRG